MQTDGRKRNIFKIIVLTLIATILLTLGVFLLGRYGWKLGGVSACESAGISKVEVTEGNVHIEGFYPGSFPEGFIGYYAEQEADILYVGFKFSVVFGWFETGDFSVDIPVDGAINEVIIKSAEQEYEIWSVKK